MKGDFKTSLLKTDKECEIPKLCNILFKITLTFNSLTYESNWKIKNFENFFCYFKFKILFIYITHSIFDNWVLFAILEYFIFTAVRTTFKHCNVLSNKIWKFFIKMNSTKTWTDWNICNNRDGVNNIFNAPRKNRCRILDQRSSLPKVTKK